MHAPIILRGLNAQACKALVARARRHRTSVSKQVRAVLIQQLE